MRTAVCDDDRRTAEQIARLTGADPDYYSSGKELLSSGKVYDLIFMDIEMDGENGLETAERLRKLGDGSLIVFVSGHDELIADCFGSEPFDFLVKPIDEDKFRKTIERAEEKLTKKTMIVNGRDEKHVLDINSITHFDIYRKKITYHCRDAEYTEYASFSKKLARLKEFGFVEYNKGCAVNLAHIRHIKGNVIVLKDGTELYMSAGKKQALVAAVVAHASR